MSGPKKIFLTSLGCPKNQVDSEVMLGLLRRRGYVLAPSREQAQVLLVNTCSFIEAAKQESIDALLELAQLKKSGACEKLLVAGCLPQMYRGAIERELPEVDCFLGTGEFGRVGEVLDELYGHAPSAHTIPDPEARFEGYSERLLPGGPSAYLKIAEGCDRPCSFCVIPNLRGPQRSRPLAAVIDEARRLARAGTLELSLIAQDLTSYGDDLPGRPSLARLLRELCRIEGLRWLRLHYGYPDKFTDELIETIASEPKIAAYLDIPLQHVSDRILKLMRRGTREKAVRALIGKLRARIPGLVLRTTFIVGFPGESEGEFTQLLDFVGEARFERMGAFAYSREEGTPASELPGQVGEDVKRERLARLMEVQQPVAREHARSLIGTEQEILIEGPHPETQHLLAGRLSTQAPEIDGMVHVAGLQSADPHKEIEPLDLAALQGTICRAQITGADVYDLVAEVVG